jgi:hypothetical protein
VDAVNVLEAVLSHSVEFRNFGDYCKGFLEADNLAIDRVD